MSEEVDQSIDHLITSTSAEQAVVFRSWTVNYEFEDVMNGLEEQRFLLTHPLMISTLESATVPDRWCLLLPKMSSSVVVEKIRGWGAVDVGREGRTGQSVSRHLKS
jgi:hypothetical protein